MPQRSFACLGTLAPTAAARLSLPASVGVWRAVGPEAEYTPETLHEYLDGAAELYLSYALQRLTSRRYLREDGAEPAITLDVFELLHPEDAFGLFAHGREGTPDETVLPDIGQDALQIGGLLFFWKGRHYVSILAYPETTQALAALPRLARAVAAAIAEEGSLPALVAALPTTDLIAASVRFFRHPIWLNAYGFVSDENVLDLGPDCAAAMARYRTPDGILTLVLADYPSEGRAGDAEARVRRLMLQGDPGVHRIPDGWAGVRRSRRRVALVLRAPTAVLARLQLEAALLEAAPETAPQEAP